MRLQQFIILALFLAQNVLAQQDGFDVVRKDELGRPLHVLITENTNITIDQLPQTLKKFYGLSSEFSFREISSYEDALGKTHVKFQLLKNGVEIKAAQIIAHGENGKTLSFNGHIYAEHASGSVTISEETALEFALSHLNATQYHWQDTGMERMIKLWKGDSKATYYPEAKLIYIPQNLDFSTSEFYLCYGFEINSLEPVGRSNVFVDASSGRIIATENLMHTGDSKGTANTRYRGVKPIVSDSINPNLFRLRESGRGDGIETYNMQNGTSYGGSVDFYDSDNYWNNYNSSQDEIAGDAHYGAEMTYDYYLEKV